MNIEKLAKHLKEFTLDEINMIAECDCKTELAHLLNGNEIVFEHGMYKYRESLKNSCLNYRVFVQNATLRKNLKMDNAILYFLTNYVNKYCKKETIHQYKTIFKIHILPYFKTKKLEEITQADIIQFYKFCEERCLQPRRIKNILALLNQILKYYQNLGVIDRKCVFQVRRLTDKNRFYIDRIVFKGDLCQN